MLLAPEVNLQAKKRSPLEVLQAGVHPAAPLRQPAASVAILPVPLAGSRSTRQSPDEHELDRYLWNFHISSYKAYTWTRMPTSWPCGFEKPIPHGFQASKWPCSAWISSNTTISTLNRLSTSTDLSPPPTGPNAIPTADISPHQSSTQASL